MSLNSELSTAKICAFSRAYHSNVSKNKVFDDYLAYDLMGKEEYDNLGALVTTDETFSITPNKTASIADFTNNFLAPITLSRICFTENKLKTFGDKYEQYQYVICGAGYDTFSFRNNNPNIEIFEVDHPDMQMFKRKRIKALKWNIPSNVHFVAIDFEKDDFVKKLLDSGFDPKKKTFFSILGVAYYLTLPVFAKTVSYISHIAAPGSLLVFDYPNETIHQTIKGGRLNKLSDMAEQLGETMCGGYYFDDLCEALRSEDFKMESHLAPSDIQERFFAGKLEEMQAIGSIYLVSAIKKEETNYTI